MPTIDQIADDLFARLHALKLQKARFGYSVPPHIEMEIDDVQKQIRSVDEVKHLETLLQTHRRNLEHLLGQASQFGSLQVPTHVANQIQNERRSIAILRKQCAELGFPMPSAKIDVEEAPSSPTPVTGRVVPGNNGVSLGELLELKHMLQAQRYADLGTKLDLLIERMS